ncbi:MAG: beta-galactosidase [Chloroflexi bacterium]|nr:beta-galactosidase [Chloroflexota bacterium]MCC6891969.1 beta-galactosidase [Anaerolineae bacterium]
MQNLESLPISHTMTVNPEPSLILTDHLNLGGTNPHGDTIGFTSYYMTWNGQPCIPVMGEFHFSRYAHEYWADELLKIKAGGVTIVATYVFWNHIEEEEGRFDWTGSNNLRAFVRLCGEYGLQSVVRIGPFAHGECRNGGIPDWLYGRPFPIRSNDKRYLAYVERLYGEINQQLKGLLFKDGGPVIGIQLENEYMHAGAPWEVTYRQGTEFVPAGNDGAGHILILKQMAREAGFDVPIYICTGWLRSPIPEGEVLPMQGGYVFTPWVPDPDFQQPPTHEFLFRNRHAKPVINGDPTYDPSRYPYACCEIGGGTQDTYYQRNPVPPEAVEGLAFMNLAGGANLIGYYMYHGGTNPVGKHGYMNEYTVPRRSYDFQAPLREFGQFVPSYGALRLLHTFFADFGDLLAPMQVSLPQDASTIRPEDTASLRWALRSKDGAGFLFLNTYQDHVQMQDLQGLRLEVQMARRTITLPQSTTLTLQKNISAILPIGLTLSGIGLHSATTQLLAKLHTSEADSYFCFAPHGMVSEYVLESASFTSIHVENGTLRESGDTTIVLMTPGLRAVVTLTNSQRRQVRLITLTREQAEQTIKQTIWGEERLILSNAHIVPHADECWLYSRSPEIDLYIYPTLKSELTASDMPITSREHGLFTQCHLRLPTKAADIEVQSIAADKAVVKLAPDILNTVDNIYLSVDYIGDIGSCFIDGKLVGDNFWNGTLWELGLKQLLREQPGDELYVLITPTQRKPERQSETSAAMAYIPGARELGAATIRSIKAIPEYKVSLALLRSFE